jgi:hypothetical protein
MKTKIAKALLLTFWLAAMSSALYFLLDYEKTPGRALAPPLLWPPDSDIQRRRDGFTLVMAVHPQCPCTRATIAELSRLMAHAQGRLSTFVLFLKPEAQSSEWVETDLWSNASLIPGVEVRVDHAGVEAARFRALTSGATALYDRNGELVFYGGITSGRGHEGDNAGRSSIENLINGGTATETQTAVFGCPLFTDEECVEGRELHDGHNR